MMNLGEKIRHYCRDRVEERDRLPDSFSVDEDGLSKWATDEDSIEISGVWMEESEVSNSIQETPSTEYIVTSDGPLYEELVDVFHWLHSNVNTKNGNLDSFSFKKLSGDNNSIFNPKGSDYGALGLTTVIQDIDATSEILDLVVEDLQELDSNITEDDLVTVECAFSDTDVCVPIGLSGKVRTDNPHRFYSDVDDVAEYKEKTGDSPFDGKFRVFFRIGEIESDVPEPFSSLFKTVMDDSVSESVEVDRDEWFYEGESVSIEDGVEKISFWVRTPFNESEWSR